ncbi:MAG TPA: 2-phospho-L-lactate transferase CofD family protein, partial [Acidimicrobiales bacterium]
HGTVAGQVAVKGTTGIDLVSLVPGDAQPPPLAVERIIAADQVVIGPGSLFTSVLAAVAVGGIAEAVASTKAQVVYVCNLRGEVCETEGYDVADHVAALARHNVQVDVVLCDSIRGMGIGTTEAPVHEVPLTGENTLVHSPAKLAQALSGLLA